MTGVVSLPLALVLPSVMLALLAIWVVPAGTALATATANVALPFAPPASVPTASVQTVPAGLASGQFQSALLLAALNVVFVGTVSFKTTLVKPIVPVF